MSSNANAELDVPVIKSEPVDTFDKESCVRIENLQSYSIKTEIEEEQYNLSDHTTGHNTCDATTQVDEVEILQNFIYELKEFENEDKFLELKRQIDDEELSVSSEEESNSSDEDYKTSATKKEISENVRRSLRSSNPTKKAKKMTKISENSSNLKNFMKFLKIKKKFENNLKKIGEDMGTLRGLFRQLADSFKNNLSKDEIHGSKNENLTVKTKKSPNKTEKIAEGFTKSDKIYLKNVEIFPKNSEVSQNEPSTSNKSPEGSKNSQNSMKILQSPSEVPKTFKIQGKIFHKIDSAAATKLLQNSSVQVKIPQNISSSPQSSVKTKTATIIQSIGEKKLNSGEVPNDIIRSIRKKIIHSEISQNALEPPENLPLDIQIKEEPTELHENFIPEIKIKEEILENQQLMSDDQAEESTFIITEVKQDPDDDEFSYFNPGFSMNPENSEEMSQDDDVFQYNIVNSFKSDLATRRSVSHTVVSEKSKKSKAEIALQAMQELMKIEQEKKLERERSSAGLIQAPQQKAMNVALNINGTRVVTKVALPNVEQGTQKIQVKKPGRPPAVDEISNFQCPVCLIKFKTYGQLVAHKRLHDTGKAKLNTAEMTKNVYVEVKMKIEQIGNRRSIHVLLPNYDYAFIVTNSTANKLYMKCFRQACEVKAYSTNDGKFYLKEGEKHSHGPDRDVIVSKINEMKMSILEKTNVINKQVHEAIIQKQKQKNTLEEKKSMLIERIKRSQEAATSKNNEQDSKRRRMQE